MAILIIPDQLQTITEFNTIQTYLNERGVLLEQWQARDLLPQDADQASILNAYNHVLKPFMAQNGYQVADVICVDGNTPNLTEIRAKFLREHTHSEDEVRFFIAGQGYFWFNLEQGEPVICVKCEAGDLLSVPAGVKHWFDLGEKPDVKAIRIFIDPAGWVPFYTDSNIEQRYQAVLAV